MPIIEQEDDDNHHHHHHHQQLQQPSNAIEPSPQPVSSNRKHHHGTTLPTEIIIEVLLKLPVESLLRCKFVCKLWFSLISDPHFVKSHLNLSAHNNNNNNDNTRLVFRIGSTILTTCCLDDNGLEVVDYPLKSACKWVGVVGSCNGLLCLSVLIGKDPRDDILFIWNPSIKKYHKLPSDCCISNGMGVRYSFGYDESTDDYKVVSIFQERVKFKSVVKMYSLRNGSWKDIGAFPHGSQSHLYGNFLNGALHWAASDGNRWAIVSLDLATETYGEVVMPPAVHVEGQKELTLRTLGEWLCLVCDYCDGRVDLFAMKAYGVLDSWTKLFSIPYTPDSYIDYPLLAPLCISNDGKILFTFGKKLMIYDSNSSSFSDVQNFNEDVEASTFFESLVSPMPPAAALEHRAAGSNG